MKIYTVNNIQTDKVEILLDHQELKKIIHALIKFEEDVDQFKRKNKDKESLGFTHLHLQDGDVIDKNNNSDIVFYLDLNE